MRTVLWALLAWFVWSGSAHAEISFAHIPVENGPPVLVVKGDFELSDSPDHLSREVAASGARIITFDSNGGNIVAAMAYGRAIRSLGLSTFQLRATQCASACALAFVGGTVRQADPGSIGVHQSSFSPERNLDGHSAVAAVQEITAQIMTYLIEMGVDPRLLQLSLSIAKDDMRYLTASEMQAYKVTSGGQIEVPKSHWPAASAPSTRTVVTAAETAATDEQKALAFMTRYHDAWSLPNAEAFAFLGAAYGDRVNFYGKSATREEVLIDKRRFADRWSRRAYSVRHGSESVHCTDTCQLDGSVEWFAQSARGDRASSGTADFTLVWDPKTGKILSEVGKVSVIDRGVSRPSRLITQWHEQNTACRGGRGDSAETARACGRRDALDSKLAAVGWCYGREGDYGYQMEWHQCATGAGQVTPASAAKDGSVVPVRPSPAAFPARGGLSGQTRLPDFRGRDRDFNTFRTRIRAGMREGPNFAGHYSLIQIGCGTGCSFAIVADNRTGRPMNFPRGGEDNMYLDLEFQRDSRLLAAQWADDGAGRCYVEFFDFDRDIWKPLSKHDIGPTETCYNGIRENIR